MRVEIQAAPTAPPGRPHTVMLLTVFGVQAGMFVVPLPYFQTVLGWSGLVATLAMLPMAVLMMVASGFAPGSPQ